MSSSVPDVRYRVVVTGKVQGVFFRDCTKTEADRLGLVGWVRNKRDGSVEAEIEGEKSAVTRMVGWFSNGSPMSRVEDVNFEEIQVEKNERGFVVRY